MGRALTQQAREPGLSPSPPLTRLLAKIFNPSMHKGEAESEEESPQLKGVEASLKSETLSQEKKKKL